ncbi:putative thioredoxin [Beutenbergia cavernae DSM 12333]|uniref:Putative thioredoxin n=1 Tax=Beutenbergia cavernae (strain ATCC BAA-8 / DSM 12333 / CCUG 43141 / JCM 11478 / NBRC 16432 / NCIMB 13614 / HKI 0122) TaxID=471853 RepID=C5C6F7_BEUC1|nr:thioredoxin family protein [Beutenbergia cavernae]ACQ80363.1 putative thioredoxin [Beutenbergia cavernae DSM 12333]
MLDLATVSGRLTLAAVVLLAATLGWLLLQRGRGRATPVREARPDDRLAGLLAATGVPAGRRATVVQVSAAACAPCRQAARVWASLAREDASVTHVELDVEDHAELVGRLHVLRTPTSFVFDGDGRLVSRVAGAPSPGQARDAVRPLREAAAA